MSGAILVGRTALLAKIEGSYDTMPSMTGTADALLIDNCSYDPDFKVIERKFYRPNLSPNPQRPGRKLAKIKFDIEMAGNGVFATPTRWGRLLRACGMLETNRGLAFASSVLPVGMASTPLVSWATNGTLTPTDPILYVITVTTGGASGTARCSVTPNDPALDTAQTNVAMTSGSPVTIGSKGLTATPTWTGNLAIGQTWLVNLSPGCIEYTPRSSGHESISLQLFFDGALHQITGAFGNVSFRANAGEPGIMTFEFTGRHVPYSDAALPSVAYESQPLPPIFENARLSLNGIQPVVSNFSFDAGTVMAERSSANRTDGLLGMRITDRNPRLGITPEAQLAASGNLWAMAEQGAIVPFTGRIGNAYGNRINLWTPCSQVTALPYQESNGIRTHNMSLMLSSLSATGDDEFYLQVG